MNALRNRAAGQADLSLGPARPSPTPLSLAQGLLAAGEANAGSAAALVLRAAEPWSPATHDLLPAAARAWAVAVLRLGKLLSRKLVGNEGSFFDAWHDHVMPRAIDRESGVPVRLAAHFDAQMQPRVDALPARPAPEKPALVQSAARAAYAEATDELEAAFFRRATLNLGPIPRMAPAARAA